MKESYLFLATGFEEVEALTAVDIMRRAAMPVKMVSIGDTLQVTGAHGITVNADILYAESDLGNADWLIVPGGMPGATNLANFEPLTELLKHHADAGRPIASICASPSVVLSKIGLLNGREATCYPGMEDTASDVCWTDEAVVADEQYVLGNGPANAMQWALGIVEAACGAEKARDIAEGLLF